MEVEESTADALSRTVAEQETEREAEGGGGGGTGVGGVVDGGKEMQVMTSRMPKIL